MPAINARSSLLSPAAGERRFSGTTHSWAAREIDVAINAPAEKHVIIDLIRVMDTFLFK
jgi:hypothetical protein